MEENKVKTKRVLAGKVVKLSGINTLKVQVERKFPHQKYGKIIKEHRSYLVNYTSEGSSVKVGDLVEIRESKPFSKKKAWELVENK